MYSFNHLFPKILFVYNLYGTCWKYCFTALNEYQSILELILAKFFQSFIRDLDGVKDHNNTKNREKKQKRLSYCKTCWVFFVKKWPKKENWLHGNFFSLFYESDYIILIGSGGQLGHRIPSSHPLMEPAMYEHYLLCFNYFKAYYILYNYINESNLIKIWSEPTTGTMTFWHSRLEKNKKTISHFSNLLVGLQLIDLVFFSTEVLRQYERRPLWNCLYHSCLWSWSCHWEMVGNHWTEK